MSTRRKTPPPAGPGESLTLVDEWFASADTPMPAADAAERVRIVRHHLEQIKTAPNPDTMSWRVVAMVGNVIENMLELGIIDDDTGLLPDAQEALRVAAERTIERGTPIRFTGPGLEAVTWMVDAFADLLGSVPHQKVVRALRLTDLRMRAIDSGQRRPGDYVAKRRPA